MKAEIITVGTELLLGRIQNSNATYLAQKLAYLGIDSYYQTVVGDNIDRIKETLEIAHNRADLVIICGGLGPTRDDVTKEAVSQFLDIPLVMDSDSMDQIRQHFSDQHRTMLPENVKQAQHLQGGGILKNDNGLAIGDFYHEQDQNFVILPGPPSELQMMVDKYLIPALKKEFDLSSQITSSVLRFFGLPESELMGTIDDIVKNAVNPSIASYAKFHEIWIRLTDISDDPVKAEAELAAISAKIIDRLKPYFIGKGTKRDLPIQVVDKLRSQGLKVTAAESLTGGMFQSTIAGVSGASNVFDGGFVTYANSAKIELLGISEEIVAKYGVVSSQIAQLMAEKSMEKMHTDIGVSFTGVAGPDSLEGHPAGTVYVGLAMRGRDTITKLLNISALDDRETIREKSVIYVLQMLKNVLQ